MLIGCHAARLEQDIRLFCSQSGFWDTSADWVPSKQRLPVVFALRRWWHSFEIVNREATLNLPDLETLSFIILDSPVYEYAYSTNDSNPVIMFAAHPGHKTRNKKLERCTGWSCRPSSSRMWAWCVWGQSRSLGEHRRLCICHWGREKSALIWQVHCCSTGVSVVLQVRHQCPAAAKCISPALHLMPHCAHKGFSGQLLTSLFHGQYQTFETVHERGIVGRYSPYSF